MIDDQNFACNLIAQVNVELANLVKTTQTFAEEQEGLLRQQLDRSMEGVEERLRSVESRSGASSMSGTTKEMNCSWLKGRSFAGAAAAGAGAAAREGV